MVFKANKVKIPEMKTPSGSVHSVKPYDYEGYQLITVLSWNGYSKHTGEYNGTLTQWIVEPEGLIRFSYIAKMQKKYECGWMDEFPFPDMLIPDRHKRIVRSVGRTLFSKKAFMGIRLFPKRSLIDLVGKREEIEPF